VLRDYTPIPGTLTPGRAAAALRVVKWREVSLLFTTGETVNATADSIPAYTDHFGQGTGGHGRAFAHEESNLTARRLFHPEKYPWPITTNRVSSAGGIRWQRYGRFTVEGTTVCATQLSF